VGRDPNFEAAEDAEPVPEVTKFEIITECFSAQKTMVKLFSPLKYAFEDQEFEILNSVKVFSIAVIVLGNTFYFIFNGPVRNLEDSSQTCRVTFSSSSLLLPGATRCSRRSSSAVASLTTQSGRLCLQGRSGFHLCTSLWFSFCGK
jgi:hypothetical protein